MSARKASRSEKASVKKATKTFASKKSSDSKIKKEVSLAQKGKGKKGTF